MLAHRGQDWRVRLAGHPAPSGSAPLTYAILSPSTLPASLYPIHPSRGVCLPSPGVGLVVVTRTNPWGQRAEASRPCTVLGRVGWGWVGLWGWKPPSACGVHLSVQPHGPCHCLVSFQVCWPAWGTPSGLCVETGAMPCNNMQKLSRESLDFECTCSPGFLMGLCLAACLGMA